MTLNSSGPISLAGTTAGVSIEIENGGNGTTQISLNDTAVRTLAGVPSGAITMPTNFYGKSNVINISYTFTTNTANASLNVTSISGYSAGKSNITVTVNSGVYLWSNSTATPGLTLTGGSTGDTITLVNNGYIMGQGGTGGIGYSGANGSVGGAALSIGFNISLTNNSYIGGGGGGGAGSSGGGGGGAGGGGGGALPFPGVTIPGGSGGSIGAVGGNASYNCNCCCAASSGGGGGRIFPGVGGAHSSGYGNISPSAAQGGGSGGGGGSYSSEKGGNGGSSNNSGGNSSGAAGGAGGGGGWGAAGGSSSGHTGGSGGNAIALNGHTVTYITTGNIWGAVA